MKLVNNFEIALINYLDTTLSISGDEIATMPIQPHWTLSFDVKLIDAYSSCRNIVLFSTTSKLEWPKTQVPQVQLCDGKLKVTYEQVTPYSDDTLFPLDTWVSINVAVSYGKFTVKVDGDQKYTGRLPNPMPKWNVKLYVPKMSIRS